MNNIREIEFIMISEANFEKLELLEKDETEVEEQVYEDVVGFESLGSKVQTRTTAFSCKKEKEDYDESFLMSRPLPWVVRVYFKMEDSMKGILCSGKGLFEITYFTYTQFDCPISVMTDHCLPLSH